MVTATGNYSSYATASHSTDTASHSTDTASDDAVSAPSFGSQVLDGIYQTGMNTASGALAGYVFGFVNPVGGAIFAVSSSLSHAIATGLAERYAAHSTLIKAAVWATSFIASIAIGITVATAAGFPLTTLGAIGMTATMFITRIGLNVFTTMATAGAGCCLACIGGLALAAKEKLWPTPQPPSLPVSAVTS